MRTSVNLRPGVTLPCITAESAEAKNLLTRNDLKKFHLKPSGLPCACSENADGTVKFYFSPDTVSEAEPEEVHFSYTKNEKMTLESGNIIERMSIRRAFSYGYYTKERLEQLHLDAVEEPVAYSLKKDGSTIFFFDKRTAIRLPLMCVKCGKDIRYKKKLCKACYSIDLAERREQGNAYRAQSFGASRERTLFFDLELTGFYDRDEIISISIVDGNGELIMNTLVKPTHTHKWKKTEKIHGITPEMVEDAPTLDQLIPEIKELFERTDALIAYGVSTDYSHIKTIYDTREEQEWLHSKVRCCAQEYVRYIQENHPDLTHASLSDAMACLEIEWEGVPHTSLADTYACRKVWEKLFPNYYID